MVADIGLSPSELLHGATAASLTVSSVFFGTSCALKYVESMQHNQKEVFMAKLKNVYHAVVSNLSDVLSHLAAALNPLAAE
jgi:hypothetical protein